MQEKILEQLRVLGFQPQQVDESNVFSFTYEGSNYMYFPNDQNEELLLFLAPSVLIEESPANVDLKELAATVNADLCYIKASAHEGNIYLAYERELLNDDEGENLSEIISKMITHLDHAIDYTNFLIYHSKNEESDSREDVEEDESNTEEKEE